MMSGTIKNVNDWTKLVLVLSLLCAAFGFKVNAQDKPLSAPQLANLITGLKQTVQENLAVSETGGKQYAAITKKWDARKDLAGKSKTQVIDLLYQDVKSVVTDPGMQYQISSAFSLYKQMPDDQFSGQTTSPMTANSKPEAVERLTNITFPEHPYVGIEAEIAKLAGTKNIEAGRAEDRKNRLAGFDAALKVNSKLNADQKAFVKTNYNELFRMTDKITEDAMNKNFPTERWVMEGLEQVYTAKFSLEELNDLIAFFDTENTSPVLKYIRQMQMEPIITGNGGKLNYTAADKAEYDRFAATALGKKFINAYLTETKTYAKRKETAARSIPDGDGFAIYEPANLNKLFNKFVAENYKK